jgi:hypothetical protein
LPDTVSHEGRVAKVCDHEPLELAAGLRDRSDDDQLADVAGEIESVVAALEPRVAER